MHVSEAPVLCVTAPAHLALVAFFLTSKMSGISGSFRVPTIVKRRKKEHGLAAFDWSLLKNQQELGSGSFGTVYSANYGVEARKVVVKKLKGESIDTKRRFLKEAEMLNGIKHSNIPAFLGFSDNPYGLMMEYAGFEFSPFGVEKKVSNLEDFYHFVDCEFNFEAFADILLVCLKDTVTGLEYLHRHNIVHRDLKPSNILVSNQHYCDKDETSVAEMYAKGPIVCKVTDFGLSRSLDAQTQSLLQSRTDEICRGTPVYMAPEIHTARLTNASQDDLKMADIWSLGIMAYAMVNPNLTSPYRKESESLGTTFNLEIMKHFMQQQQLPSHDPKYEVLRVTEWWQLEEIFHLCANFEPSSRPTASEVFRRVSIDEPEASLVIKNLQVSQNTALEVADLKLALQLRNAKGKVGQRCQTVDDQQTPENDGTNACVFLAMGIGDAFLQAVEKTDCFSLECLVGLAEQAITNLPSKINNQRDSTKKYEPSEAKSILKKNELLAANYELSEECISGNGVFSEAGRKELFDGLSNQQPGTKYRAGLYTCCPYTFLVGIHDDSYFLVDTHPIGEELGGDGNGILVATKDLTSRSCSLLVQWILKRLKTSGLKGNEVQSFAWLMPLLEIQDARNNHGDESESPKNNDASDIPDMDVAIAENNHDDESTPGYYNMQDVDQEIRSSQLVESSDDNNDNNMQDNNAAMPLNTENNHNDESTPGYYNMKNVDQEIGSSEFVESSDENNDMHDAERPEINTASKSATSIRSPLSISSDSDQQVEQANEYPEPVLYKGDALTPAFAWENKPYSWENLVEILLGEYETERLCVSTPVNIAHNVTFLVDNSKIKIEGDIKCDDMGAWAHTGSPKRCFKVQRNESGKVDKITSAEDGVKSHQSQIFTLKRVYYVNKSSTDVRKIISTLQDWNGVQLKYTLVQYLFKGQEHEVDAVLPHGNSKKKKAYRRLMPSTRKALQTSLPGRKETAKEVLDKVYCSVGDVTKARSHGQLPRGPSDVYNARFAAKKEKSCMATGNKCTEINSIWELLEKAKREEEGSKDSVFIRECRIHPDFLVVLASDRQLQDLKHFCTNPNEFCIFGADPTFNIFEENISLTVTTYRNLKLHKISTKKPPVFIGPVLMHQRKDWKTYARFTNSLTTECPDLEGILACGTDGEKALIDGLKRNFRFALLLRCFIHFKDNVKRQLSERGLPPETKTLILNEIFGKQEGNVKYTGLVDCDSEEEFDNKLMALQSEWDARETANGRLAKQASSTFYEWFRKEKASDIKESMLKSVRVEAGLGNPPREYTNNDPESANFVIKHGLKFEAQKPHEFIQEIKNIIERQYRDEDRAVFGKGPYEIRPEFQHLAVDDKRWSNMSHEQVMAKLELYVKSGMDAKKVIANKEREVGDRSNEDSQSSNMVLPITASGSGITTVPMPILRAMFEKANRLLQKRDNVIPKPGATDGSFIVAGHANSNTIHVITPGKGGCLKCDRNCVNSSTKICEHILAVAQVRETLDEFLAWYRRSKKGPKVLEMALGSGPKNAGKKLSNRKRTNVKKPPVTEVVDLLEQVNAGPFSNTVPVPFAVQTPTQNNYCNNYVPGTGQFAQHNPVFQISSAISGTPQVVQHNPAFQIPSAISGTAQVAQHIPTFQIPSAISGTTQVVQHNPTFQIPSAISGTSQVAQHNPAFQIPSAIPQQSLSFKVKWVTGTRVSRCYGCNREIKNPPEAAPDDLIVVYRDIRQYRDRNTGQVQFSSEPQNVHFHLRAACIRARYPNFPSNALVVPTDFPPHFRAEHIQRLTAEFGWVL